jgi:hypothetical protein
VVLERRDIFDPSIAPEANESFFQYRSVIAWLQGFDLVKTMNKILELTSRRTRLAGEEGGLCIEPGHNLVEVQEKPKLWMERIVVFLVLQFLGAQIRRDDMQMKMSSIK